MPAPRLVSRLPRPQPRHGSSPGYSQTHSERSEWFNMAQRTARQLLVNEDPHISDDGASDDTSEEIASLVQEFEAARRSNIDIDRITQAAVNRSIAHVESGHVDDASFAESEFSFAETAVDLYGDGEIEFFDGVSVEDQDEQAFEWEEDGYHGNSSGSLWPGWSDVPQMGRIERARSMRPWRNLREMYRVQTNAFRAAINAEARQDLADFQQNYNCVVETDPADAWRSYEELSDRFQDDDTGGIGPVDAWTEYVQDVGRGTPFVGFAEGSAHDGMAWFFQRAPLRLNVRYNDRARDQRQMGTTRLRLANSVLSLHAASQSSTEWCPCKNLGPGPTLLKEAFCTAISERRHYQRLLLEQVYIPQSRGNRVEEGRESFLYAQYILASAWEQRLEVHWVGFGVLDRWMTRATQAFAQSILDMFDEPDGRNQAESILAMARLTANHPSNLWPCFSPRRVEPFQPGWW